MEGTTPKAVVVPSSFGGIALSLLVVTLFTYTHPSIAAGGSNDHDRSFLPSL